MLRLSLTLRTECMDDAAVLIHGMLDDTSIMRFVCGYKVKADDFFEGYMELQFLCPDDHQTALIQAVSRLVALVSDYAELDDMHLLRETLNFTDEFTGERMVASLQERIIARLTEKLGVVP
jgi:hypothetical protein